MVKQHFIKQFLAISSFYFRTTEKYSDEITVSEIEQWMASMKSDEQSFGQLPLGRAARSGPQVSSGRIQIESASN
ncbi:MAG: hypothetical protein O3C28_14760 [Proteobacteria bacterium]|nr:hypothetical protein [Pseudomonadota bacterium]